MQDQAGSYRYHDGDRVVTGEIWSGGPLPHTVWVLGPDGPVVVDIREHRRRHYDMPTYHPGNVHEWRHNRWSSGIAPIDLRGKRAAITLAQWAELTVDAFDVRDERPDDLWQLIDTLPIALPDTDV